MVRSLYVQGHSEMRIPTFWKNVLLFASVGKAAIAGAGMTLAILGAFDIAFALTASNMLRDFQHQYLDYLTLGGGAVGAVVGFFINK